MSVSNSIDVYYMQRAIELAKRGQYTTRPNPNVGCVLVRDGQVLGEGFHARAGQPHAEVMALRAAQVSGQAVNGATAYVTLEPCSHHGRTPPCADALIAAGIARVVIAVSDPNPKVAGNGIAKLRTAGLEVQTGICKTQAAALNAGFLRCMQGGLPWVRAKIACSLDGRIALADGTSKWITGDAAREDGQRLRARSGAIITGSQTVLSDTPRMDVRSTSLGVPVADIPAPWLVVLDRQVRISLDSDWVHAQVQNRPLWMVQSPDLSLVEVLNELKQRQVYEVLIEAGARVTTAFLQAGLVDELIVYQAPCLLGQNAQPMFIADIGALNQQLRLDMVSHETLGQDRKLTFTIAK
ncbi:bifunctional diaminohydroxyphosphoribosylaminopyrimidine deaminase/5-amino-6-(5-phosphoribosylamino)uracil reductase RibD [Moraxella atlantae]|uniref:bifunctional diaminohydroxyphosphoribosylaminopyrimidine deaminase/5-amino-6-(5-phosphoribosylamino)uracil reductase RibD n=1 Tax=Faucicola atlantae TaxID=34059 RepID=UPI003752CBA9